MNNNGAFPSSWTTRKTTIPKKKRWTWKKPADKPARPLSGYNLFFLTERQRILAGTDHIKIPYTKEEVENVRHLNRTKPKRQHRKSHGKISFRTLSDTISERWKNLDQENRVIFITQAKVEKALYDLKIANWRGSQHAKSSSTVVLGRAKLPSCESSPAPPECGAGVPPPPTTHSSAPQLNCNATTDHPFLDFLGVAEHDQSNFFLPENEFLSFASSISGAAAASKNEPQEASPKHDESAVELFFEQLAAADAVPLPPPFRNHASDSDLVLALRAKRHHHLNTVTSGGTAAVAATGNNVSFPLESWKSTTEQSSRTINNMDNSFACPLDPFRGLKDPLLKQTSRSCSALPALMEPIRAEDMESIF